MSDIKERNTKETKQSRRSFKEDVPLIKKIKKKRDKNNLVSTTIELEPNFRMEITTFFKAQGFKTLKDFFEYLVKQEMDFHSLSKKEQYEFFKNKLIDI